ncbi:MAG: hypothetical protein ACYCXW_07420 [Solirubrobacteraceae bacterium]
MLTPGNRLTAGLAASALLTASLGAGGAYASSRHLRTARHHRRNHRGAGGRPGVLGGRLITGRLSSPGYTIIALGANGRSTSSSARSFSLKVPAPRYTLALVSRQGVYAGTVVVGGGGSRVIVGLHGGIRLGPIGVLARLGYARPTTAVPPAALVRADWAWARHGVPIGNGRNLGLVVSPTKGTGPAGLGGDSDRSGVPNAFDIASGGNGVINELAPATVGHGLRRGITVSSSTAVPPIPAPPNGTPPSGPAPTGGSGPGTPSTTSPWMSQLFLPIEQTVNQDAAGVTQAEIDAAVKANLNVKLLQIPSGDSVDLDCNGLSFCSPGGSGRAALEGLPATCTSPIGGFCTVPFPAGSLDPATGLGQIVGPHAAGGIIANNAGGGSEFSLFPYATTAQIGSGDVITENVSNAGTSTQIPTTLAFVFTTVPAIASYSDTAGDAGSIAYPDATGLGGQGDPIKVAAGPNGDVVVSFTAYRPQRAGIAGAGEPAFMDIGHLWYSLDHAAAPAPGSTTVGSTTMPQCPAADFSALSSTLASPSGTATAPTNIPAGAGALVDSAADAPAGSEGTIGFTVDLSQCLASQGSSFPVGQPVEFDISANSQVSSDHANQTFWLERTS